ncbi:MAG: hypothetical protein ACRC2T_11510 [Thermoguttaceae bacterium]
MKRRNFLFGVFGTTAAFCAFQTGSTAFGQEKIDADMLKKKLPARSKDDEEYIDKVISMRDTGKLTNNQVLAAYNYAMKKRSNRFAYFSAAMNKIMKK